MVASGLVVLLGALQAVGLGDGVSTRDGASIRSDSRPAYFDSPEYELSLLRVAETRSSGRGIFRI